MPIEMRKVASGRSTPFQKVRYVYVLTEMLFGDDLRVSDVTDHAIAVYVNHAETCPNWGQFSRKGSG